MQKNYSRYDILEFANLLPKDTGIDNVVIWIGLPPPNHGNRIKISNTPNKWNKYDNFTLTIPDFNIIGYVNNRKYS